MTMINLSNTNFSKLELPRWNGLVLRAVLMIGGSLHIRDGADSSKELFGAIACRNINDGQWITGHRPKSSFVQLDELKAICAKVDAFIASETKRTAEAALPSWRDCGLEEAQEWTLFYDGEQQQEWRPIDRCNGDSPKERYRYRTRAPKKDGAIKLTNGFELRWDTNTRYGTICKDGKIKAKRYSDRSWDIDTWKIAGIPRDEARQTIAATEEADRLMGSGSLYAKAEWLASQQGVTILASKEPTTETKTKMPNVKPPNGTSWQPWSQGTIVLVGPGIFLQVPDSKRWRDAMLACVAAHDQQNGLAPVVWADNWVTIAHEWSATQCHEIHLRCDMTPGSDANQMAFEKAAMKRGAKFLLVEATP